MNKENCKASLAVALTLVASTLQAQTTAFTSRSLLFDDVVSSATATDVDGDGLTDMVYFGSSFTIEDRGIFWRRNLGADGSSFGPERTVVTNVFGGARVAVDVDADGDIDIVQDINWYENTDGSGSFGPAKIFGPEPAAGFVVTYRELAAGDIDGDRDIDLVAIAFDDPAVVLFENLGGGNFAAAQILFGGAPESNVSFADLDGDTDLDVLVALSTGLVSGVDNSVGWYENLDGEGSFGPRRLIAENDRSLGLPVAADINGDGDLDIVAPTAASGGMLVTMVWHENLDGDGNFGSGQEIVTVSGVSSVAPADLDGDDDVDLLVGSSRFISGTSQTRALVWYENLDGEGTFSDAHVIFSGARQSNLVPQIIAVDIDNDQDIDAVGTGIGEFSTQLSWFENRLGDPTTVVASVLPSSRSGQVGAAITAFASIVNAGDVPGLGCGIAPATLVPADFSYQTTNPATNVLVGSPNNPVTIAAGEFQSFLIALTPTASFGPVDVGFTFDCANSEPAPVIPGLNTLLLSASDQPVPDIVALALTQTGDGILSVPGELGAGAFAVATVNVGADSPIAVSATATPAGLPVTLSICETNPMTAACDNPPAPTTESVMTDIAMNATPTFSIFVTGNGNVPFDPAVNRVSVRFTDVGGVVRGSTSVAVRTVAVDPPPPDVVDTFAGITLMVRPTDQDGVVQVNWVVSGATLAAGARSFALEIFVGGGQQWQEQFFSDEPTDNGNPPLLGGVPETFCFRMIGTASGQSGDPILGSGTSGNKSPCI